MVHIFVFTLFDLYGCFSLCVCTLFFWLIHFSVFRVVQTIFSLCSTVKYTRNPKCRLTQIKCGKVKYEVMPLTERALKTHSLSLFELLGGNLHINSREIRWTKKEALADGLNAIENWK